MLYRDPTTDTPGGFLRRLRLTLAGLGRRRRQRLAELDMRSAGHHLRRDLGLDDLDLFRR
jgi:hypothetical protein